MIIIKSLNIAWLYQPFKYKGTKLFKNRLSAIIPAVKISVLGNPSAMPVSDLPQSASPQISQP
jgi:hypothetical protein